MAHIPVALQLFTVRELLADDYVGTLQKVKEIGYDVVQLTGAIPYEAPQMREILDDIGLAVAGIHVGGAELESNLGHWISYCKAVGTADLVWPYVPEERRQTREDWLSLASTMDELGGQCRAEDIRLSYHNHSFEFVKFDGAYALDLLYENSAPENLLAEIDTYWVKHGGESPVAYVEKYGDRMSILHLKDMAADEDRSFTEIGRGILDWEAIFDAAAQTGVEFYCVEQDRCAGDPLDSACISLQFIRDLLGD